MRICILHTNDVHNRWNAEFVERLRTHKTHHQALLLDAGDCIRSGNLGIPLAPESAWEWMRQAGYDAIALGNREFHITPAGFLAKLRGAPCPVLCANIAPKDPDTLLPVQPFWYTEHQGVRVGVVGLTVPMVTARMKSAFLSAYLFSPPVETARRWVQELRPKVDLLIALTHIGLVQDRLLASEYPEIDIILGGHSHTPCFPPERVEGVWVAQAYPYAKGAGLLTLVREGTRWQVGQASLI